MKHKLTRRANIAVIAVLGVLAAVGVGYAAIPSADGVIHSCYNAGSANPSGQLRVIDADAGAKCSKSEKALAFNQKGPKGDTGAKGDKGDPCLSSDPACVGPQGPAGKDGIDGIDGKDGKDGAPGAPGGSDALVARSFPRVINNETVTVAARTFVPAGSYVIHARLGGDFGGEAAGEGRCFLHVDSDVGRSTEDDTLEFRNFPVVLLGAADDFRGGTIRLECRHTGDGVMNVASAVLVATRVK